MTRLLIIDGIESGLDKSQIETWANGHDWRFTINTISPKEESTDAIAIFDCVNQGKIDWSWPDGELPQITGTCNIEKNNGEHIQDPEPTKIILDKLETIANAGEDENDTSETSSD